MAGGEAEQLYQDAFGSEQSVIGSMLIDDKTVGLAVSELDETDFTLDACRMLFRAFRTLYFGDKPLDPVSVTHLAAPEDAAMRRYAMELMDRTATAANISVYIQQVKEHTLRLRLRSIGKELMKLGANEEALPLLTRGMDLLSRQVREDEADMERSVLDFYKSLERVPEYLPWGFSELDEGLFVERGDFVVLAGRPSDGKTALALQMAYAQAEKLNVGFFSLETGKRKVRDRVVSHVAQISAQDIKLRTLSEEDWSALAAKSADMAKRDLTVLQASGMTATEIQATSQAYGFQVVFIDYVQLVAPESGRRANRQEPIAGVSMALHTFAQTTGTLVVELAQLTRQDRAGGWREPDMHDLKESGQFEQDADMIVLLFRPNPKDEDLDQEKNRILKIAKNKEYKRGRWPLYFDGDTQTFSVVTDDTGRQVMRQMVNAGKKAKAKNRAEAPGQQRIGEIVELPESEAKGLPF